MVEEATIELEKDTKEVKPAKLKKRKKKSFTIFDIPIIKILAYFIIFSVVGFVLETLFALVTKGVLESRKSFLYGPFCAIYGLGATTMIVGLQKFNKNNYTLFFGGAIIGSIVEYIVSWIGEIVFDVKWWDYSTMPFNINGRICLWFSIFWGVLAIYLMSHVYPKIDKLLDKIPSNIFKAVTIAFTILMLLDWAVSSFALQMFYARIVSQKNIEIREINSNASNYMKLYNENSTVRKIVDTFFSDETIIKAFPNLKLTGKNGEIILVKDLFPDIQPYYLKIFTPAQIKFQ